MASFITYKELFVIYSICVTFSANALGTAGVKNGTLQTYDAAASSIVNLTLNTPGQCRLLYDGRMHGKVQTMLKGNTKLIIFRVNIDGYRTNPLLQDMTMNYKSNIWYRSSSKHGLAILALAFNYDILSLSMLTFGVAKVNVTLRDEPRGCMEHATEDQKIRNMYKILITDFTQSNESQFTTNDHFCHQVIGSDGRFYKKCCQKVQQNGSLECMIDVADFWIKLMYSLLLFLKIVVFLFGPVFFKKYLFTNSMMKMDYVVNLRTPVSMNVHIRKVKSCTKMFSRTRLKRLIGFDKFRQRIRSLTYNTTHTIQCDSFNLLVNHAKLVNEKRVPVGLLKTIFDSIFMCGLRKIGPFKTLCAHSIFGSCETKCLFFDLGICRKLRQRILPCSWYQKLTWGVLARLTGGVLLVLLIPLPYYIRLIVYYKFEHEEIESRKKALENIGLDITYGNSVLQYLTPMHPVFILCYIIYFCCFVMMASLRSVDEHLFENIAKAPLYDFRNISLQAAMKMVLAHLLLPLEKFGICGIVIGIPYWIVVIPLAAVVFVIYAVPVTYLIFRIMIPHRPTCMKKESNKHSDKETQSSKYIADGVNSIESMFMLNDISGTRGIVIDPKQHKYRNSFAMNAILFLLRLATLLFVMAVLLIMAEFFGFVLEIGVFTLMGTIVNAAIAAKYVMLFFWIMIYASSCYNHVYEQYVKMNKAVFDMFKNKLTDEITKVTRKPSNEQDNTAFYYFKKDPDAPDVELQDANEERRIEDTDDIAVDSNAPQHLVKKPPFSRDKVLHWTLKDAIVFVDKKDKPRIPLKLFREISKIKAPGCPGPIVPNLLAATRNFLYMVIFLLFVLIVVMSFGNIYEISTTNQMIVTLAGGFLPFVIRFVLSPKPAEIHLNTYSFDGKIHEIIRGYSDSWPIYDIPFTQNVDREGVAGFQHKVRFSDTSNATVDLLVTIEDQSMDEFDSQNEVIDCKKEIVITPRRTYVVRRKRQSEEENTDAEYELLTIKRI